MASIVGALGIPHNPFTALGIARGDDAVADSQRLYAQLERELAAMEADTLIVPIFAIGVAERSRGPSDYPMLPQFDVAIDGELAAAIQTAVVAADFDVG